MSLSRKNFSRSGATAQRFFLRCDAATLREKNSSAFNNAARLIRKLTDRFHFDLPA